MRSSSQVAGRKSSIVCKFAATAQNGGSIPTWRGCASGNSVLLSILHSCMWTRILLIYSMFFQVNHARSCFTMNGTCMQPSSSRHPTAKLSIMPDEPAIANAFQSSLQFLRISLHAAQLGCLSRTPSWYVKLLCHLWVRILVYLLNIKIPLTSKRISPAFLPDLHTMPDDTMSKDRVRCVYTHAHRL